MGGRLPDSATRASANLTEQQKLKAELFDNKINSLGFSAVFAALSQGLDLIEFIQLDFLTNLAAFDAGVAVWNQKARWDACAPPSSTAHRGQSAAETTEATALRGAPAVRNRVFLPARCAEPDALRRSHAYCEDVASQ